MAEAVLNATARIFPCSLCGLAPSRASEPSPSPAPGRLGTETVVRPRTGEAGEAGEVVADVSDWSGGLDRAIPAGEGAQAGIAVRAPDAVRSNPCRLKMGPQSAMPRDGTVRLCNRAGSALVRAGQRDPHARVEGRRFFGSARALRRCAAAAGAWPGRQVVVWGSTPSTLDLTDRGFTIS